MVLKGVISPVTKPTAWVSSLTYPCKPDGSLHICLDPKDLNKAIVQEHYKAPTLDEITHHLSGATCFSKLDVKDGFWSINLDEDSSYLTTFNTHCGRYRFLHMPFGLKMSQDVFQMQMDQATDHLPGIIVIHDDICVFGCTPEEHDEHLLHLMESAKTHGIVFIVQSVTSGSLRLPFMVQFSLARACDQTPPKSKPYKTFLPQTCRLSYSPF